MKFASLLGLLALLPVTAFAQSECQYSIEANPNIVIPVHIERHRDLSSHPDLSTAFFRYEVSLGADNEFDITCITQPDAVMLFTLADSRNFEFLDIRFYEDGLPSTQMVRTEVHADYIRVINKNDGTRAYIKYTLVLRDKRNGAVISQDPAAISGPPA